MPLAKHTDHNVASPSHDQTLISLERPISAQPLYGMDGSDAMALSMIVSIPALAYIYMEPMETASSNLHASGLTYSPQHRYTSGLSQTLIFQESHLRSATV